MTDAQLLIQAFTVGEHFGALPNVQRISMVPIDDLRRMAMRELKAENVGVKREGYRFVVREECIEAFTKGLCEANPALKIDRPRDRALRAPGLGLEGFEPHVSLARREKERIAADHRRIQLEQEADEAHRREVAARLREHRARLREMTAGGVGLPALEPLRMAESVEEPQIALMPPGLAF
ncbi:hypothetical protein EPN42_13145 [bacterium]|nr:MAG: hypothetical protein EPN42_13145 [bacterium]